MNEGELRRISVATAVYCNDGKFITEFQITKTKDQSAIFQFH